MIIIADPKTCCGQDEVPAGFHPINPKDPTQVARFGNLRGL
ncbi:hypothetical protein [Lichenicoccus sp.]